MAVRIEDVQMAKSQRSYRVRLGSEWYGAYMKYKPDQLPILTAIGKMVEVETTTLEKGGPWITAWTYASDQTPPAGARPVTPHQGSDVDEAYLKYRAAQARAGEAALGQQTPAREGATPSPEPARQLTAEELKVVNGLTMGIVQHWLPAHEGTYTDKLELIQLAMKAIATTVREL